MSLGGHLRILDTPEGFIDFPSSPPDDSDRIRENLNAHLGGAVADGRARLAGQLPDQARC